MERRTYEIRTFGCQMNVHDSERIAGVLEADGYVPVRKDAIPDLIVFNTCAVRENAANRLYGTLGLLRPLKEKNPRLQFAVGGCLAQNDKNSVLDRAPWVDVVFGTHNLGSLPVLLRRSRHNKEAQVEIYESLQAFPSTLPAKRESSYAAWVSISVGCNNTCTYCIVPALRGKEVDRPPTDIVAEVKSLVDEGIQEITLLGQNVNSYGMSFADPTRPRNRQAFSELLRACGEIPGLRRLKFTSPHPAEFTDDVVEAMAETPAVCPQLHMPLQSGSDKILRAMRRSYRQKRFLSIVDNVRAHLPDAALTTDIIVGFPGETEEDFQDTLDMLERVRFASAFTFQYSPRPDTPAAEMPGQVPPDVMQDRYDRLIAVQERITLEENQRLIGRQTELLVTAHDGRKNAETRRMSGRSRDGRLVHFATYGRENEIRPGDLVTVDITSAAPHHLLADGGIQHLERTPAGDLFEQGRTPQVQPVGVGLGIPVFAPTTATPPGQQ